MPFQSVRSMCLWLTGPVFLTMCSSLFASGPQVPSDAVEIEPEIPAVPYVMLGLIRDPAVQNELQLKPAQVARVKDAIVLVDHSFWKLRDVSISDCATQLEMLDATLRGELNKELTARQVERLDQIVLQRRSWRALASPDVAKRLGLSSEQIVKLRTALKQTLKEHESIESKLADQSARVQKQARMKQKKAEVQRFTELLTTKQREEFSKLLGTGFDFSRVTPVGCIAPELRGVDAWINTDPMTMEQLRGKVVVLHFWAFDCINCIRNLPHYKSWSEDFSSDRVTILGIHTPETSKERKLDNLRQNIKERDIEYPVVFDANSKNWEAWGNQIWPSVYLIDKRGRVRYWWYGELNWNGAKGEALFRRRIQELLTEN